MPWMLAALLFGPFAMLAYWPLRRASNTQGYDHCPNRWLRFLASTQWAVARTFVGAILAVGLLYALPPELRDASTVRFPLGVLLPMATGLLLHWLFGSHAESSTESTILSSSPLWAEPLVTLSVLIVAYPLVIWLGETWIAAWWPLDSGLTNGATWIVLLLAAWASSSIAFPVQVLLARRSDRI
jgi:hypothetical protein